MTLDETALRADAGAERYGRLLAQQLFAAAEARRGWRDARQRAQGGGEPLRVRLANGALRDRALRQRQPLANAIAYLRP